MSMGFGLAIYWLYLFFNIWIWKTPKIRCCCNLRLSTARLLLQAKSVHVCLCECCMWASYFFKLKFNLYKITCIGLECSVWWVLRIVYTPLTTTQSSIHMEQWISFFTSLSSWSHCLPPAPTRGNCVVIL